MLQRALKTTNDYCPFCGGVRFVQHDPMCGLAGEVDPFNPNNWEPDDHEYRIYLDASLQTYVVVDAEDYSWASRWCWDSIKRHGSTRGEKIYARRTQSVWENGVRVRTFTVLLHVEIMKRTGKLPPSPEHKIVDHRDGDTLNCRRKNLHWATYQMNASNSVRWQRMAV